MREWYKNHYLRKFGEPDGINGIASLLGVIGFDIRLRKKCFIDIASISLWTDEVCIADKKILVENKDGSMWTFVGLLVLLNHTSCIHLSLRVFLHLAYREKPFISNVIRMFHKKFKVLYYFLRSWCKDSPVTQYIK